MIPPYPFLINNGILCIGGGIFAIYFGIRAWTGSFKRWYPDRLGSVMHARIYVGVPFGLVFCGFGLIIIAGNLFPSSGIADFILLYFVFPIGGFGLVIGIFQPKWIRPPWVRWLEDHYWDRLSLLIVDARQDVWAWERRVSTQWGLEEWAREVAGEPQYRPRRWFW